MQKVEDACAAIVRAVLGTLANPGREVIGYIYKSTSANNIRTEPGMAMFIDVVSRLQDRFIDKTVIKPLCDVS